jgi:hypothetical protein
MINLAMVELSKIDTLTVAKDVTTIMQKGDYLFKHKYGLLYLYDIQNDFDSVEFITTYGWRLHNHSSSNIPIITYFSEIMVEKWVNVINKSKLLFNNKVNPFEVIAIVNRCKNNFNVEQLPSIVIIQRSMLGYKDYRNICLASYTAVEKFDIFKNIMDTIIDNYDENLSVIYSKINSINAKNHDKHFNTYNFIADLVEEESKKENKYTLADLARELNIDVKTLYNKRRFSKFTRDEILYFGLRFSISLDNLNKLLRENNHLDLGLFGRDGFIRVGLINNYSVEEVNRTLSHNGYQELNYKR